MHQSTDAAGDAVTETALDRVFAILGSQAELAKRLDISAYAVSKWKKTKIPAERVLDVERIVDGRVTRHELRPDIYPIDDHASVVPPGGDSVQCGGEFAQR